MSRSAPATATGSPVLGTRAGAAVQPVQAAARPYARAISGSLDPVAAVFGHDEDSPRLRNDDDSAPYVPKSVVVNDEFDWRGETPIQRRWRDTVIYELHVKGMTQLHDRVPEHLRGTYAGLASPAVVDYLKDLGVTAVELLPIHQFCTEPAVTARGLSNYWGYNSIGFFAPHGAYAASGDRGQQVTEFKEMVRAFHDAGLEVILDVVYNHTAEAGADGPTLSLPRSRRQGLPPREAVGAGPALRRHLLGRHRLRQHDRRRRTPSRCG